MTSSGIRLGVDTLLAAKCLRERIQEGWATTANVVELSPETAEAHRGRLSAALPGERIAVAPGRPVVRFNNTFHPFRADSDFVWLIGYRLEGAVLLLTTAGQAHDATLCLPSPSEPGEDDFLAIVDTSPHSPVLHRTRCSGPVREDDVLLLAAPAEREVYELVHEAHLAAMAEVRPGQDYVKFEPVAMRVLAIGLHAWGLLSVSVDEALSPQGQQHRRFIVCGSGHFLGLDVHGCAAARPGCYRNGPLAEGMALTVEPGLYFRPNDLTVPPEFRGLGRAYRGRRGGHRGRLRPAVRRFSRRRRRGGSVDGLRVAGSLRFLAVRRLSTPLRPGGPYRSGSCAASGREFR